MLPAEESSWRDWYVPLSSGELTLGQVLRSASEVAADPTDVPIIVKLVENPEFHIPGITVFNGAVNLHDHDCIHAILGRGLLSKDEAFTIGFTMGSTKRVTSTETNLYAFASKNLYPGPYRFDNSDIEVFKNATQLAAISDCEALNKISYQKYYDCSLSEIRKMLGIEENLLKAYYEIEKKRYPDSIESQRLV